MASKREEVLQALLAQLQTVPLGKVERNRLRPERIPPEGLIILRDGEIGEPEVLLSPLSYRTIKNLSPVLSFSVRGSYLSDILRA